MYNERLCAVFWTLCSCCYVLPEPGFLYLLLSYSIGIHPAFPVQTEDQHAERTHEHTDDQTKS